MAPVPLVGMPSASAKLLDAVKVSPTTALPVIVTEPVGALFVRTSVVAALTYLSLPV